MEKSIENIWNKGFLREDALIAPKINDLYNAKSANIVDKLKRMFAINIKAIIIGSWVMLGLSYLGRMQYMGWPLLVLLNVLAFISFNKKKSLDKIDKNLNSYDYLFAFNDWLQNQIKDFTKVYRVFYPLFLLSVFIGFWFLKLKDNTMGQEVNDFVRSEFPNHPFLFGLPVFVFIWLVLGMGLLVLLAKKLYKYDIQAVYGKTLDKLEELLNDMEELRSET